MNTVYLQCAYVCVLDTYFYFSDRVLYTALGYRVCIYCMYAASVYIHDTGMPYIWIYFSLISKFLFIWFSTTYLGGSPTRMCIFYLILVGVPPEYMFFCYVLVGSPPVYVLRIGILIGDPPLCTLIRNCCWRMVHCKRAR